MKQRNMADKLNLINKKVWLAGHRGLVGRAIYKLLKKEKATILTKTSKSLDLRNLVKVRNFIKKGY